MAGAIKGGITKFFLFVKIQHKILFCKFLQKIFTIYKFSATVLEVLPRFRFLLRERLSVSGSYYMHGGTSFSAAANASSHDRGIWGEVVHL